VGCEAGAQCCCGNWEVGKVGGGRRRQAVVRQPHSPACAAALTGLDPAPDPERGPVWRLGKAPWAPTVAGARLCRQSGVLQQQPHESGRRPRLRSGGLHDSHTLPSPDPGSLALPSVLKTFLPKTPHVVWISLTQPCLVKLLTKEGTLPVPSSVDTLPPNCQTGQKRAAFQEESENENCVRQ